MAIPQGTLNAGWVGQHAGMAASQKLKGWVNIQEYILQTLPNGWVNMQELAAKPQKTIGLGVGQHAGIVGQHEQEWWVNMGRNLQQGIFFIGQIILEVLILLESSISGL